MRSARSDEAAGLVVRVGWGIGMINSAEMAGMAVITSMASTLCIGR
jgi:hypothetical protein